MPVDFLEIRDQIKQIGALAPQDAKRLHKLRQEARQFLEVNASELDNLRDKVKLAASQDQFLRCALPVNEPLNSSFPAPPLPKNATILAADGSQINPDRHAPLNFYLINVGALTMRQGSSQAPIATVETNLYFNEYSSSGTVSENRVSLERDTSERKVMAKLAQDAAQPIITMTDGPMELWGGKGKNTDDTETFTKSLEEYKQSLLELQVLGAAAGGYVDKPRADLVVQLLEVASTHRDELKELRANRPLRGVTDANLFRPILEPGHRSAVFAIQSKSAAQYKRDLALHFFYLNVGRPDNPWFARVEIPSWVAGNPEMLNNLHAVLIDQCRILGTRAYPYLLHRAHEEALVTREEKEQIMAMLMSELQAQGVEPGQESQKQAVKNLSGRRRFSLGSKRY